MVEMLVARREFGEFVGQVVPRAGRASDENAEP